MANRNDLESNKFLVGNGGQIGVNTFIVHGDGWMPQVANLSALPATGNSTGDIRQTLDDGSLYRWNGSSWVSATSSSLPTLADGNIWIGSNTNAATAKVLSGDATMTRDGVVTVANSAVISKVLTGYSSGSGTVSATDSILQAIQKLNGNDALKESLTNKDSSGGYVGLTLMKINFNNVANSFTSFLTNSNTAARTYTFKDASGTVAFTSDITGTNSGTNTGDQTNISGNAATVTTNANLTGVITSVGNATSLGSFTSAQLATAITDETGSGSAVFATSPTLITPALGTPSALVGTNITGTAAGLTAGTVTTNANLTGDISSIGNSTTLANTTVTPGSYTLTSITVDSKGRITAASSGTGGLIGFTASQNTATPNGTVYVDVLNATASVTNADIAIVPKGSGAFLLSIPDNTSAGGNKRGTRSIDLQILRNDATNVASGNSSVLIGSLSTASGDNSTAIGTNNTASGSNSTAIGNSVVSSGSISTAFGNENTAQSYAETVIGTDATIGIGTAGSYVSTDRLFVIGNGTGAGARSNAFTMLKNGTSTFTNLTYINIAGTGTTLTNPNLQATNSVNNFTQIANQNMSNGVNSSADLIAYPDNNTNDTTGFADIGIAGSGFSQAAYAITTPNDGYFFTSAVSGASKLGNMVLCTDSTGSSNSIVFGVNGFSSLNKERARIDGSTGIFSFGYASVANGIQKYYNSTNANTVTIQSGVTSTSYTLTLPTAVAAGNGYALVSTTGGVLSWAASSGLSWGATATGTSGIGIALTIGATASGGTIGYSNIVNNTQSNYTISFSAAMGSSAVGNQGFYVSGSNASTGAVGFIADMQTGYTGKMFQANFNSSEVFSVGTLGTVKVTTSDLSGVTAFNIFAHTASGTLTANTTTQETTSTSRTYTLTSGSVTDNFIGSLFSRTNVINGAGGALSAQGAVVKITGTDTQTAGILTPSYDLLALSPSLRSTGSSVNVTIANSVITAPTNGHIYAVLGNTQTVAQIIQKIDLGTSSQGHTGLYVKAYNASTSLSGINIDLSTTGTGAGLMITGTGATGGQGKIHFANSIASGAASGNGIQFNDWISQSSNTATAINIPFLNVGSGSAYGLAFGEMNRSGTSYGIYMSTLASSSSTGTSYGWYVANLQDVAMTTASPSKYFSLNNAQSAVLSNRSTDASEILFSRTNTATSGTKTDAFNLSYLKRTSAQNGVGGTFATSGSVLKLENVVTQIAGTITDVVNVLSIVQDVDSSGNGVSVTGSGTSTTNSYHTNMATGFTGDYFHGQLNAVDKFRVDYNGAVISASSITTGAPNTGTAASWKLGSLVTGQVGLVLISTQYIELDINGTLYRLATL